MRKLTKKQLTKIDEWMQSNARPFDLAKWNFLFNGGSKADIVEHDVFDMGERMMLNFGHTIGHAIEGCYGFGHYTHGEGVAAGMSMLTGVTEAMGLTKAGTTARLRKVIKQYGLPTDVDASAEDLIPYISNDKKMRGNHITLVIIEEIGKARLLPLAAEDLPKYIRKKDA